MKHQQLTDFDLMILRAGGRTPSELEDQAGSGFGFALVATACACLADALYHLVIVLETAAHRAPEDSHRRLAAKA